MNNKQGGPKGPGPGAGGFEKSKDFSGTWKKIIKYSNKYMYVIVFAIICAFIATILTLLGPDKISDITQLITDGITAYATNISSAMQNGIDISTISMNIDLDAVYKLGFTLVIIYIISYALNITQGMIMATITQKITKKMRKDISTKINKLPMSYFGKTSTGDVLSRITNDVDTVSQSLNMSIGSLVSSFTLLIGSLVMMFYTNVTLTITAVLATIIGFALMIIIMSKSQRYFTEQQEQIGALNGHIEEMYTAQTVVKAYNAEEDSQKSFDKMNEKLRHSAFKAQSLSGLMMPIMTFIGNFGYVAVCVVGAILTIEGKIGISVIVAFIMYVRYFTNPLGQIAQNVQSMQSAAAAGERVFEFLEAEEMPNEENKSLTNHKFVGNVEFSKVNFGYNKEKQVIKNFSMKVKKGQKVAIVGPTGAGKTTIINLLMKFYDADSGDIYLDNINTKNMRREEVHSQFCMVLQDTWLFEGTVKENLVYSTKNITDEMIEKACSAAGLHHFITTLPKKYDTVLSDNINLSGGQKQQLTIARAMLADKPMLILDEATSSVDTRTEVIIQSAMDKLMKNRTSFVIAHRLSTIKNADVILVMKDGEIIENGNHEELIKQGGFYKELYNSQFDNKD